ncbi:hypothetical protein SPBR_01656 [Sporothrix brasiliensis 5110]|uniref:EamA domain-containing protein n=1 Tax=Sporothrix brasiliensis 5110 TaxID=1398154 RepID=A0A0C2FJG0_9PEZI|nr:uncharacterized protein SPBR_01656 [Sporothrix brasiliensis 5110]KIH91163.1 hypothetical protein SPBR_01656 [Sporothrix brasiliensis 5110]
MARSSDRRSGTPLLHANSPASSDVDHDRAGHRTPRRLSDDSDHDHDHDQAHDDDAAPSSQLLHSSLSTARPTASRQSSFLRSRSPADQSHLAARLAARKKYAYASVFLVLSLVSFTIQTELAAWVQHAGWDKAYCMLYLTHGSWSLLWPVQLLILRLQKRREPWATFWRRHVWLVRTTAVMVETRDLSAATAADRCRHGRAHGPAASSSSSSSLSPLAGLVYMAKATAFITVALTVAGLSWYVAVNMTSPSDLTAIYNCSAFFAYAFSVPLLRERLRLDKSLAVLVAVAGVLVVAYGDAKPAGGRGGKGENGDNGDNSENDAENRLLGNLIIGAGSVLYGLYEVLYKRYACPPDGCSPGRGMIFANTVGSCIGVFTLTVLWLPLPVLHLLGIETFALPTGKVAWYLFLSVVMNATFAGSFLVLISLTSPVLSSVASLLTIFIVAVADWWLTGQPPSAAALLGGSMIVVAFALLSWSTYKEMAEEEHEKEVDMPSSDSDEE